MKKIETEVKRIKEFLVARGYVINSESTLDSEDYDMFGAKHDSDLNLVFQVRNQLLALAISFEAPLLLKSDPVGLFELVNDVNRRSILVRLYVNREINAIVFESHCLVPFSDEQFSFFFEMVKVEINELRGDDSYKSLFDK